MENKYTEKEGFVGMSDTMKHYELEKLVEELRHRLNHHRVLSVDYLEINFQEAKELLVIADKQGYMRGEEHGRKRRDQELLIMMDEVEKKGWDFKRFISTFSSMVDSQSHDAISKLKENI